MANQNDIELILSTIAVVTKPLAGPISIEVENITVLRPPLSIGISPPAITILSSPRDQIEVLFQRDKAPLPDEATLRLELSEQYMGFLSLIKQLGL